MKRLVLFIIIFGLNYMHAQEKPVKKGAYTASIVHDVYKYDTIRQEYLQVKTKRPYLRYYFDQKGRPVEKWYYEKYDANDRHADDYTEVYKYSNQNLLMQTDTWVSWRNEDVLKSSAKYKYDQHKNETEVIHSEYGKITRTITYSRQYDIKGNDIVVDVYDARSEKVYDSLDRLIERRSYNKNLRGDYILHSEFKYTYTDSSSTLYWKDNVEGKPTDRCIIEKTFNADNDISIYELKTAESDILKRVCYYNNGKLELVEHFRFSSESNKYLLYARSTITIKGKPDYEALRVINKTITNELDVE